MPLGTSLEDSIKVIERKQRWKINAVTIMPVKWPPDDLEYIISDTGKVVIQFILSKLPLQTVDAILTFEGEGLEKKLVSIEVRKYAGI